ncbi:hypothetical protein [Chitinophaga nivalis]|uniref:MoxR-vWA-beta-propeller ternary system domain-containing protein n=1 Tax=Chitinophaga nivalis TaxID=2991709 RepID=A0ABT3IR99_9BACT|nr:hypothetical protein [Chitinophaga nivalis]MCW3463829.1 hypothetical protein [Chitinophaga nivalis]MCW3486481.1 hypothetical protein [Chitinophaga nivalis]
MTPAIQEIVMQLPAGSLAALGPVRCFPGLQAAVTPTYIWLRGIPWPAPIAPQLHSLPALHTYLLDAGGQLFPLNGLTPVATLEDLPWQPLQTVLPITLPVSALPAQLPTPCNIQLIASDQVLPGNALRTTLDIWCDYAATAPLVRLQPLTFAAAAHGEVLIIGTPLPAIPGKAYVQYGQLLLPAGYTFNPPGIASLISAQLNPQQEDLLLFDHTGAWERISPAAFVPAGRSAARLTRRDTANG